MCLLLVSGPVRGRRMLYCGKLGRHMAERRSKAVGRGIALACEQCDFSARLLERVPFALHSDGTPYALDAESAGTVAGYWSDWLCGECRTPVRLTQQQAASESAAPCCPACGTTLLAFEDALRELAEACHSRAWVDLARERQALAIAQQAFDAVPSLQQAIERGDSTTLAALHELSQSLVPGSETLTLAGLDELIENAHDLAAARQTLDIRLRTGEQWAAGLETCVEDEAHLPGVPCPRCGTGHLAHWPLWL